MSEVHLAHASSASCDVTFYDFFKQWLEQPGGVNSSTASTSPPRLELFESVTTKLAPFFRGDDEWKGFGPLKLSHPSPDERHFYFMDWLRTNSLTNFATLYRRTTPEPISASINIGCFLMLLSTLMQLRSQQEASDDWSKGRIHAGIARQLTAQAKATSNTRMINGSRKQFSKWQSAIHQDCLAR